MGTCLDTPVFEKLGLYSRYPSWFVVLYDEAIDQQVYTVKFDLNGGTSSEGFSSITDQTVAVGGSITEPSDPIKTGYTFGGWYASPSFLASKKWDFSANTVTEDIALYAQWEAVDQVKEESILEESTTLGISPRAVYQFVSNQTEFQAAINTALAGTKDNYIYITNDFTITSEITVDFDLGSVNTIFLMGEKSSTKTLTTSGVRHFNMSSTTGTIVFDSVKLDGNSGLGGISTSVADLSLDGVDIQNSKTTQNGGGIYSSGSGTLKLINATIQNCGIALGPGGYPYDPSGIGGGVYIASGNLNIEGGEISYNYVSVESTKYGGGIYFSGDGTLTLSNANVSYNWARYGGGIYTETAGAKINLEGSTKISRNYGGRGDGGHSSPAPITGANREGSGAGIYAADAATITMNDDSVLSANWAMGEGEGGGIYAASGSNITIQNNAQFVGNTANANGGGIYLPSSGSILIKNNARFSDNIGDGNSGASGYGGGMYAGGTATINILDNAVISGNQVQEADGGGAIYIDDLENLDVATNVLFEYNVTKTGYYMSSTDPNIAIHTTKILNSTRSVNANSPSRDFTYLYNNYDVYYNKGMTTSPLTTYTVTFDPIGGTTDLTSKKVALISTYGSLPEPTKTGYEFGGWYTEQNQDNADPPNGSKIEAGTMVETIASGNHTLYAYWKTPTYTVTYNMDGVFYNSREVTQGGYAPDITSTVPSKPGYTLDGWYTSPYYTASSKWDFSASAVTSDITLYARWKEIDKVKVTFVVNGGDALTTPAEVDVTPTMTYGENTGYATGTLPTPTRTGYTFDGWYTAATGGTQVLPSTTVSLTTDHVLFAHWTIGSYTVSYYDNNPGSIIGTKTVTFGSPYGTLLTSAGTKYGYTFEGWCTKNNTANTNGDSSTLVSIGTTVTIEADHTLYAYWKPVSGIIVTFDAYTTGTTVVGLAGPTPTSITVTYDSPYGTLANVSRSGYTFTGWNTKADGNGASVISNTPVANASAHTLYAQWTAKDDIEVTFDPNGGSVIKTTQTVEFGQLYGTLPTPTRNGLPLRAGIRQAEH